jgi:RND family efflux transporter MFP subunit
VREIAGGADPVTRTYAVRVNAPTAPAAAQLGMTANVVLADARDSDLVVLPMSALTRSGDKAAVWVVDTATGKVAMRAVAVGQFREDGVTITQGLEEGDVVVTAGVHKLRAGQSVRLAGERPRASADNTRP